MMSKNGKSESEHELMSVLGELSDGESNPGLPRIAN